MDSEKLTVDVDRIRKDILEPAKAVTHLNSAGDSPMPRPVLERVTKHAEMEATFGGYEAAARCEKELEAVYTSAAQLINAHKDMIALQVLTGTLPSFRVQVPGTVHGTQKSSIIFNTATSMAGVFWGFLSHLDIRCYLLWYVFSIKTAKNDVHLGHLF